MACAVPGGLTIINPHVLRAGENIMSRHITRHQKSHQAAVDDPFAMPGAATFATDATQPASDAASQIDSLRRDLNGLKEAMSEFVAQTAARSAEAAQGAASRVAEQSAAAAARIAEGGAALAGQAAEQTKSAALELESMARRNPLSAIAAAAAIGLVIGMMGRRR